MIIETITISPETQIRIGIAALCLFAGFCVGKLHSLFDGCAYCKITKDSDND